MPVRGSGWYKRPYRIVGTDAKGRKVHRAYHWKGARDKEINDLLRFGYKVRPEDRGPASVEHPADRELRERRNR